MGLPNKYVWMIAGILLFSGISAATNVKIEEITPGEYDLKTITNHLPYAFEDSDNYRESLQKIVLELGNQGRFRDLPELGMKHPYTGVIKLGDKPQEFGVIVDVRAEEKRLYIDTNGDGSFANEPWIELLNEWYGLERYLVFGPEPIELQVIFNSEPSRIQPIEIYVSGFLNRPGALIEEEPYLMVTVRTWFLAELIEDGAVKLAAVVDCNNNGIYNDSKDALFIDYNDDGIFDNYEAIFRKTGIKIECGGVKLKVDWDACPLKLKIGGEISGSKL